MESPSGRLRQSPLAGHGLKVPPPKVAVTDWAPFMDTTQVLAVPPHAPLQPVKLEPLAAAAVKVTVAPLATAALQTLPQLMPPPVTVPLPLPLLFPVSGTVFTLAPATVMPQTLGLSGPPPLVNWITTWPLPLAVVLNVRAMARLAPADAAKMSKAVRTVAPLMATLKVRWPAAVQ